MNGVIIHLYVRTSALFTDTKTCPLAEGPLPNEAIWIHSLILEKTQVRLFNAILAPEQYHKQNLLFCKKRGLWVSSKDKSKMIYFLWFSIDRIRQWIKGGFFCFLFFVFFFKSELLLEI